MRRLPGIVVGLAIGFASVVAAPLPNPDRVRQCSRWCVDSYAERLPDGIFCIDACGQGVHEEPISTCSKACVVRHIKTVPDIHRCIDRCGR
ncbi:MAG TPA: hypothetical protein VKA21_06220 [Candidatus Binatia bacterium]|nr:hypothetical protein [Candidatus Binatia bacterium]